MSKHTRRFYNFGAFRLDTQNRRLTHSENGETLPLTPKEFEVLLFLLENAGDVVSKDALLDAVWKDSFVGGETLMRNVSWLRKKLAAENPAGAKFIETVPKLGYRFAAAVEASDEAELIIEEETLTKISVEETLTFDDSKLLAETSGLALPETHGSVFSKLKTDALAPTDRQPGTRNSKSAWLALLFALLAIAATAFAAYQNFSGRGGPKTILAAKVVPFSGLPGREDMPAFSPDGKQIAFVWNGGEADNSDVYVKLIGTGEPIRLTNTANDEIYPTFSPDARSIAFVRVFPAYEEVILIPALGGGAERKICRVTSGRASISFSPDGRFLVVVDTDSAVKSTVVFLLDWQTGERRRLTDSTESVTENTPRFSPDGKNVAFLRYYSNSVQELFVVPATGGAARQLTFDKTNIRSLTWSADGKRIIFVSARRNNQPNLWQIEASGGQPELIATSGKNIIYTAASPDGKNVAFVEQSDNINIRQITPGDKSARKFIESTSTDLEPQFSPDGTRISFASERTGNGEIWVADTDGKNQRQLTDSMLSAGSARFSPDGKFIAYGLQNGEIYIISAEGGTPRQLTESSAYDVMPAWSADGQWIYFASNRTGDYQLWKMPVAGGKALQITQQGAYASFAAPDGKWIYYSKGREIAGLWRVAADGGDEMPVPELADAGFWRSWTVTRTGIYYVAYAPQPPYQIRFYDFSNGQIKEIVTTEKTPLPFSAGLSVSADGKTILYAQSDQDTSSIILTELGQ